MENMNHDWITNAIGQFEKNYARVCPELKTKIPYTTDTSGKYDNHSSLETTATEFESISWWTNGFYPGILWQLFNLTGKQMYQKYAKAIEEKLSCNFDCFSGLHHDVGFMFLPTSVANYQLTHAATSKIRGLHAATILAGRFNITGNYLVAWNNEANLDKTGWTIIDSMMNIKLLYWASHETNDPRFKAIAIAHTKTILNNFVRNDGSVKHIGLFDSKTGDYRQSLGGQGYAHGSAWTRGQGWAIYGFAMSYEETKDSRFLEASEKIANYVINQMPDDFIMPIDFDQPIEPAYQDASAAVIIASALLTLSNNCKQEALVVKYTYFAQQLLKTVVETSCDFSNQIDNVVTSASASYHEDHHQYPIIYADYFLIEALLKLKHKNLKIWD